MDGTDFLTGGGSQGSRLPGRSVGGFLVSDML